MLDIEDILATHRMFEENRLDVRTVTLGVSLLGCIDRNGETMCQKIYDHICRVAENLVPTAEAYRSLTSASPSHRFHSSRKPAT